MRKHGKPQIQAPKSHRDQGGRRVRALYMVFEVSAITTGCVLRACGRGGVAVGKHMIHINKRIFPLDEKASILRLSPGENVIRPGCKKL